MFTLEVYLQGCERFLQHYFRSKFGERTATLRCCWRTRSRRIHAIVGRRDRGRKVAGSQQGWSHAIDGQDAVLADWEFVPSGGWSNQCPLAFGILPD